MIFRFIKANWKTLAILASVAAALTYQYILMVDLNPHCKLFRLEYQAFILSHAVEAPFRYRILVPYLMEGWIKALSLFFSYPRALARVYAVYEFFAFFLMLLTLFIYLKEWFKEAIVFFGILFVACTMPVTFVDHCFAPWSLLEVSLWSLSLLSLYKRWYVLFGLILILASLNKETSFFLPFIFLFTRRNMLSWKTLSLFLLYFLIWLVIFTGLHWFLGTMKFPGHFLGALGYHLPLKQVWHDNTQPWIWHQALLHLALFLGVFWIFIFWGFKQVPDPFLKRAVWITPFYLFACFIYGGWAEVRLLMNLYPILLPLGLSAASKFLDEPQ